MVAERAPFIPENAVTKSNDKSAQTHLKVLPDVKPEPPRVLSSPSVYDNARIISRSPGFTVLELDAPKHNYGEYNLNQPGMLEIFLREAPEVVLDEYRADQRVIKNGGEVPKQRIWILGS